MEVGHWRYIFLKFALLAMVLVVSTAEDSSDQPSGNESMMNDVHVAEKKYLAALAKNGRLPKYTSQKRSDDESDGEVDNVDQNLYLDDSMGGFTEGKRHVGAFLKAHGRPGSPRQTRGMYPIEEEQSPELDSSELLNNDKRNVASLARLGRLNAVRFGRFQPSGFGGKKRITFHYRDEQNDGVPPSAKASNEILQVPDDECQDDEDDKANSEDNYTHPNWIQSQKKRYIAALARSGRLPVWHSQRMWWGGKRDIPRAYWLRYRSGARVYGGKRQNTDEVSQPVAQVANKKCKKSVSVSSEELKSEGNEKRNLAMLARKGKLPYGA